MFHKLIVTGFVGLGILGVSAGIGQAQQPGVAERVGETLDNLGRGIVRGAQEVTETVKQAAQEVTDSVRRRFEVVRADVSRMGVQPRVYSRLHWDKTLYTARIEVHMLRDGAVLLRGVVPDLAAKTRAIELTRDTVDVTGVVDELEVLVPPPSTPPISSPAVSVPALPRSR